MATKPKAVSFAASGVDVLNAIRTNASALYQERVPVATQENLKITGNAIMQYEATQNEFLNALVNRIARVIITSKSYENPLRMFKKGIMDFGESIEEIFVNIARAHEFDPAIAEKEVYKREIPNVDAVFHKVNYKNFYKTTISNEQLRQAFLSWDGITDLIARIVDSLYSGSEFDEFLCMKQLIAEAAKAGKMYAVTIPEVTGDNAKSIVATIKSISNKLEFMSSQYNAMGVLNFTKKPNQIILLDAAFDATIDVEVLASAFNMDKADFMGQRVLVDNFNDLTGVVAAIVDRDWFMVFDQMLSFTENYNGQGLYWNYFYHVWKIFSTSPFSNAVLFTTSTVGVTSVTVTPSIATVDKGQQVKFAAAVVTTGYAPQSVQWGISGQKSDNTVITHDGVLSVGSDETATTITVTATSSYDTTKTSTATVTVNAGI